MSKKFVDIKSIFESKTIWGVLITVLVPVLAVFGFDLKAEDFSTILALAVPIGTGIIIGAKRIWKTVKSYDIVSGVLAFFSVLAAIYIALTGDTDTVDKLTPMVTAFLTAIGSILAAFGINTAEKEIKVL